MSLRARLNDERGQALVLVALCLSILLAFVGLSIDSAILFHAKRNLQIAADAAAQAGALDYLYNSSTSSAIAVAKAASSANGFTAGSGGVTVTVNTPPTSGPSSGVTGFVEAIVSKPVPTTIMAMFGFGHVTINARAVAGSPANGTACVWLMDATGTDLVTQGAYDIEAPGCGFYMNSTSSDAVTVTGNGGTLNALFADAVGGSIGHQTKPTPVTTYTAPRTNPWGNLSGPTPTSGCTSTSSATSITGTVTGPGAGYSICYTKAVTITNATLGAGLYMFENGVTISGTVTVNSGTLDIYSGTFNQGNALLNITAPTTGTYDGIALMQPKSNTNQLQVQFGSGNQTLDGYIYAPGAQVYLQDHGGGITATGVVADSLFDKSSTIRIPSYDKAHKNTTRNRVLALME